MSSLRHKNYKNDNTSAKNSWYDCISETRKKTVSGIKDNIMINTTEDYHKPTRVKNVYGGRKKSRKKSEDKIIKAIKDRIIRDIRSLFEKEQQDYYKPLILCSVYSYSYIKYESNG